MQAYFGSTLHILEHPSPEIKFPSSHCSDDVMIPSPHTGLQTEGYVPMHAYPIST